MVFVGFEQDTTSIYVANWRTCQLYLVPAGDLQEMPNLPTRLKKDCILEVIVEMQFDVEEQTEIVVGRLVDCPDWASYTKHRTPISDIPVQIRLSDPAMRHQPLFDLRSEDGLFAVKIGSHALSVHNMAGYVGWENYSPLVKNALHYMIEKLPGVVVKRVGLRYINATTKEDHKIGSIEQLNVNVTLGEEALADDLSVNFIKRLSENVNVITRIATPRLVDGPIPESATTFIDIDVYSGSGWSSSSEEEISSWIDNAHIAEKEQFFNILLEEVVNELRED
jgi:uncharacterized protein (TIGR04255 family)